MANDQWWPQNIEVERRLLGVCTNNHYVLGEIDWLRPDHFFLPIHGSIYQVMRRLHDEGSPTDPVLTAHYLTNLAGSEGLEKVGGLAGLISFGNEYPDQMVLTATPYARVIHRLAIQRRVLQDAQQMEREAGGEMKPERVQALVERVTQALEDDASRLPTKTMQDYASEALDHMEMIYQAQGSVPGISTGLTDLDYLTGGLQRGAMVVLAGRAKMGKSALSFNIAARVAFAPKDGRPPRPVGIISLEMTGREVVYRIASLLGGIDHDLFVKGVDRYRNKPSDAVQTTIVNTIARITEGPLHIDDRPGLTMDDIARVATRWRDEHRIELLIIDHLQLVRNPRAERRFEEVSSVSRWVKGLAKDLDIPVVIISQLNREVEHRDDKRPHLSDLRETGQIEQDCDVAMFLYREGYYNPNCDNPNLVEINVLANRSGGTGMVRSHLILERMQFCEVSYRGGD